MHDKDVSLAAVVAKPLSLFVLLLLGGCGLFAPPEPGVGRAVAWSSLPGWDEDRHAEAWPALLTSCSKRGADAGWVEVCTAAASLEAPDDLTAREFFEQHFVVHEMRGQEGEREGLITGYYEPILNGSRTRTSQYRYPLYARPQDLVVVDLAELYPELRGRPVRGRLHAGRVVPYYSRTQINTEQGPLQGNELLWVDDPVALAFLQIQGSGRVRLPDGETLAVGYADQNGHPYVPLGKCLRDHTGLPPESINLFTIRAWLDGHPDQRDNLLSSCNPSYVFFALRESADGAIGSLGVPLLAKRSIAVDPRYIPLGAPVWLSTTLPASADRLQRLMFAQDTGGAIKGPVRADVFWGPGSEAERLAGTMRERGRLYILLPRHSSATLQAQR